MNCPSNREPANSLLESLNSAISFPRSALLFLIGIIVVLTACSEDPLPPPSGTPSQDGAVVSEQTITAEISDTPTAVPTIPPPTATPQLAAMVNGQPILLETFKKELARYESAQHELGIPPGSDNQDYYRLVLDALIERELISQAAYVAGVSVTPEQVDAKLADLRQTASESGSFDDWLMANHWTNESFREALAAEMLVEVMVANVTADVPYTTEQLRASYIQVDDATLAESLLSQIREGADFATLASQYSRDLITAPAGGDLGYFARGSLLVPEVEEAAFDLEPEEISDIISVADPESGRLTHYIIMVTERDSARPLNTSSRHQLLQEAFTSWLDNQWSNATILYLLEEG